MAVPDPTTISVRNDGNGVITLTLALMPTATSYKVFRDETPAPAVQISTVTTAISKDNLGIADDTIYYYRVIATNGSGDSAYSNEVSVASGESGGKFKYAAKSTRALRINRKKGSFEQ